MTYLGIDFGTCTNLITRWNPEKNEVELIDMASYGSSSKVFPNVIFYASPENRYMGENAEKQAIVNPENCVKGIKRHLEEKGYHRYISNLARDLKAEDIAADIFSYIKKAVEDKFGGETVDGVVISVPFAFQHKERARIQKAAERAGLHVLGLIEEPVAAALSFGLAAKAERGKTQKILIFDLGGGTFDVTVFEFIKQTDTRFDVEVLTTDGNKKLGGLDIDDLIIHKLVDMLHNKFPDYDLERLPEKVRDGEYRVLENTARSLKLEFTDEDEAELFFRSEAQADVILDDFLEIEDFNRWLDQSGFMAKIKDVLDSTLLDLDFEAKDIDRIMMVGGTSNIRHIHDFVEEYFGKSPEVIKKPDEMVGEGAGIYCGICLNKKMKYTITRRVSYAIGIISKGSFKTMIPRNTPYNEASKEVEYIAVKNRDKEQKIFVCQKDHKTVVGCILLKPKLLHQLHGKHVGLRLNTDDNGIIEYTLYDVLDNNDLVELIHEKVEDDE